MVSESTLNPETLRRIRQIEIKTRRLVNEVFAGAYHSAFKGRGIAFDAVRPYQPGDDVRDIDWNVTARMDAPYIKQYAEERELTVLLVIDASASCFFGTVNHQKHDLAVELGAVLALSATANNDKVGLLIFGETLDTFIAPRKGRNHILRVIRDLLAVRPAQNATNLALALTSASRLLRQRAVVFILSDFLLPPEQYQMALTALSRRHDVVAIVLSDPLEKGWQSAGLIRLRDAESGEMRLIDTAAGGWAQRFRRQYDRFASLRDAALRQSGADRLDVSTDTDFLHALTLFFRGRGKRP